ncbi:MAG: DUF3307 domain-containing protein [Candidatus Gracilibacteria bacterium]|jgi:hypothetical protein|nr:DUF3307 domain-containing protein [Candidatus Gracilibacteria bacterium]
MNFLLLFFSHLVGDFVLQTYDLVKLKKKSLFGIFIHIVIHFSLAYFLLFSVFRGFETQILTSVVFVSLMHFFIDKAKIEYEKHRKKRVFSFLFDQFLHIIVIFIASLYLNAFIRPQAERLAEFCIFTSALIIITQGVEIFKMQKSIETGKKIKPKDNKKALKMRVFILIFIFLLYRLFILLLP